MTSSYMDLVFVMMEPYHRLLRIQSWSAENLQSAIHLNKREDLSWTQYFRGLSSFAHLVAMELDYRIRGRNYKELEDTRELEYGQVYQEFEARTLEENRKVRRDLFYMCSLSDMAPTLVQQLLEEETQYTDKGITQLETMTQDGHFDDLI
jgi:hypothetical protein